MTSYGESRGLSNEMSALVDLMRRDGGQLFGSDRARVDVLAFEIRESSEVARVRVTTPVGIRHVFAKMLKPRRPGETGLAETRMRLRHDFEVTRQVFGALSSTADLRAVEPIACYEDVLGVVTNEAPGVSLDVLVGRGARWPVTRDRLAQLETTMARIGRWVALFQQVAPDPIPSRLSLPAIREYIDVRLQRLVATAGAGFDKTDRRTVLAYFDRRAARVPASDLLEVPVHGDVTPSNIVVDTHSVTVLDFAMTARGSRYLDVARLYSQLEFYTAKPQYRSHVVSRLQSALLSGFEPTLLSSNPLFEICVLQHVVCHFLSHARQPGRFPISLYSRHLCRLHRRWLRERCPDPATNPLAAHPASGHS